MKKLQLKRRKKEVALPPRITNETVAEHRERILAEGRRFKYPLQYSKHKLVINTILISVIAFVTALIIGWHQLYIAQNTSNFFYPGYDICEWATRVWVADNCPDWKEGQPLILDEKGNVQTSDLIKRV